MLQQDRWWATYNAVIGGLYSASDGEGIWTADGFEAHKAATAAADRAHGPLADAITADAKSVMGGESE